MPWTLSISAGASSRLLGSADSFAVWGGSTVTKTGASVLTGILGLWPGTSITGFPPGIVLNGSTHNNDGVAAQAQADLTTAYNTIVGEAFSFASLQRLALGVMSPKSPYSPSLWRWVRSITTIAPLYALLDGGHANRGFP